MPANEFEKQVQRQLDDFELNPSASVWKKVEEQIRKRKRRRVVVFFFLLAALLTGGYFTYYSLQTNKSQNTVQNAPAHNNQNQTSTDNNRKTTTLQQELTHKPQAVDPAMATKDVVIKKINRTTTNDLQISSIIPPVSHKVNRPTSKAGNSDSTMDRKQTNPVSSVSKVDAVQPGPELIVTTAQPIITHIKTDRPPNDNLIKSANPEVQKDTLSIAAKQSIVAKQDSIKTSDMLPLANKQIQLAKRKYRIQWGIDLSAGVTSNQGQLFSLTKSADRLYASSPATTVGGTPFIVPASPSSIQPGPAFNIGVTAELQFSPRSRISAGLQYAYASNRIMKGGVVYTLLPIQNSSNYAPTRAVDQVYHGSPQNNYTNSYHFISLPVEYHWQINKSKKLRIEWNAGLSFNYLLSTNALVFNSSYGGIYYQDKNAINKMHINIGTGISFRFHSKNGMEWAIGPEVSFDTRRLVNNNQDARQFLLFTGINAKLYFGHKKPK